MTSIDLKGKTLLITGASSGIGETLARELAKKGLNVVLTGRRRERLDQIVKDITSEGGSALAVTMDVTKQEDIDRGFKEAEEKFGPVHFTIANAGGTPPGDGILSADHFTPFNGEPLTLAINDFLMSLNYRAVIATVQQGYESAKKNHGGVIILVSSIAATFPIGNEYATKGILGYGPAKAAVDTFVRLSAKEFSKEGIRIYAIAPAWVRTEGIEILGNAINATPETLALSNPIFPGKPSNPLDLVPVVSCLLDGSTLYQPGTSIICDNNVTYHGKEHYKSIYEEKWEIPKEALRDYQGKPLNSNN